MSWLSRLLRSYGLLPDRGEALWSARRHVFAPPLLVDETIVDVQSDDVMHNQDAHESSVSFRTAYYAGNAQIGCMLEKWKNATPGSGKIMVFTYGKPCTNGGPTLQHLWDDMTATCSASEILLGTRYLVKLGDALPQDATMPGCENAPVFTKNRLISSKRGVPRQRLWNILG